MSAAAWCSKSCARTRCARCCAKARSTGFPSASARCARAATGANASTTGLSESLKAETAIGPTYQWVNAVRALVRPALTLGLGGFLCAAFFALPAGDAGRAEVSESLVFAAVTAIVWWFGDRAPKKGN